MKRDDALDKFAEEVRRATCDSLSVAAASAKNVIAGKLGIGADKVKLEIGELGGGTVVAEKEGVGEITLCFLHPQSASEYPFDAQFFRTERFRETRHI